MLTPWYSLVVVVILTAWQASVAVASIFMWINRSKQLARFRVCRNLLRNALSLFTMVGACYVVNIMERHESQAIVKCAGWNVWVLLVLPRSIWLWLFVYEVAFLLQEGWRKQCIQYAAATLSTLYVVTMFFGMTLWSGVVDAVRGSCVGSLPVEVVNAGFTVALLLLALITVCTPWWELRLEMFHRRLLRVTGINLIPLVSGQATVHFVPTNFPQLDAWMAATHARWILAYRQGRPVAPNIEVLYQYPSEADEGGGGSAATNLLGDDNSVKLTPFTDEQLAQAVAKDPSTGWQDFFMDMTVDYSLAQAYDMRNRTTCVFATVISAMLVVLFLHFGEVNVTTHAAWRVCSLLAYVAPLMYWQWLCCLRPVFKFVQSENNWIQGADTVRNAQILLMRWMLNKFDYRQDLDDYFLCKETELRDPARVDQWLRVPHFDTHRDRYVEFQLWLAIMRRKQFDDPFERASATDAIMFGFFNPNSPLNPRFSPEAATITMCPGVSEDSYDMFDTTLVALTPRLEPREDAKYIEANARQQAAERHRVIQSVVSAALAGNLSSVSVETAVAAAAAAAATNTTPSSFQLQPVS